MDESESRVWDLIQRNMLDALGLGRIVLARQLHAHLCALEAAWSEARASRVDAEWAGRTRFA